MAKVLVIYDSKTGNTEKMAKEVSEGARSAGAEVTLKRVDDASVSELPEFDAIVVGSPTYFGTMSGKLKKFLDESVKVRRKLEGKVGAAFTSSGSPFGGNETTLISIILALMIHGMIIVGDPIKSGGHYGVCSVGAPEDDDLKNCRALGERVANLAKKLFG